MLTLCFFVGFERQAMKCVATVYGKNFGWVSS